MGITHLDHLYAETRDWEASVRHWEGLGFTFVERWGSEGHRAGRLTAGTATVVLAEVPPEARPDFLVFFGLEDADHFVIGSDVEVVAPLEETHWGTRWIRVRDPEGRGAALEEG